ncbi:MAG TPA: neutral zinc metallopeptidase [Gaiellaceae bacterium]|jgi:predicted metalloprotease|nr:neutral zinc metallopeptidase [Gaiellaceae bacterium]
MRWRRGTGSGQIEDRRGASPIALGGGAAGGIGVLVLLLLYLFGGGGGAGAGPLEPLPEMPAAQGRGPDPDAELKDFVAFVVQDVQSSWARSFARSNKTYEPTKLVLFENATQTGCGMGSSQTGPFYCPLDRKVYLDLGFFRELRSRFGAPGDFAQAYVIAHEFGHHVQNLLGISDDVRTDQQKDPGGANELSIRLELQADCLAGVWAHSAYEQKLLESGDLEEGLAAAAAVGDDRIQKQAGAAVDPESWTHGSSEQRTTWFRKGFDGGDPGACDTFSGEL